MSKLGPLIVVEDDEEDQELMKEALDQIGYHNSILFFTTGKEMVKYLLNTNEKPFLIITDMNLPEMNGLELQRTISGNDYLREKSIPFIFFTTSDSPFLVEQAYKGFVQGYFKKPSEFTILLSTVRSIIDYWTHCKHPNSHKSE